MRDPRPTFVRLIAAVVLLQHGRVRANQAEACTKACTKAHRVRSPGHHHTREQRSICWRVAAER